MLLVYLRVDVPFETGKFNKEHLLGPEFLIKAKSIFVMYVIKILLIKANYFRNAIFLQTNKREQAIKITGTML
jgi:hypothetical protein